MNTPPIIQPSCADNDDPGSLRVEAALNRMLDAVVPVSGIEQVGLLDAAFRVLQESVVAPFDVPTHTNAAVDGYAVRAADLPGVGQVVELAVAGRALAGRPFEGELAKGRAVRIMTGASLPAGADTVLMQEHVEANGGLIRVGEGHRLGDNVRRAGEDIARGSEILRPGRSLTPADLGLVASLGLGEVRVRRRVRVALLSTGDEVHGLGRPLPPGGVYDSNRYTLGAALRRLNVQVLDQGIVPDDPARLREALVRAAASTDLLISTGGVSVGEADFVREVLDALGEIAFWKVAMKPGRPMAFGRIGSSLFMGLPGNPVAALVCFWGFVRPVLERLMGITDCPTLPTFKAVSRDRLGKKPGRTEFQRGILESTGSGTWAVRKTGGQGSGILSSMSRADVLIVLPHESGPVAPGDLVDVVPFAGFM